MARRFGTPPFFEVEPLETGSHRQSCYCCPRACPISPWGSYLRWSSRRETAMGITSIDWPRDTCPEGLALVTNGLLTGEAMSPAPINFAVKATDPTRGGKSATRSFSLTVSLRRPRL